MGVRNTKPTIKPSAASAKKRHESQGTQARDSRGKMHKVLGANFKVRWEWRA